MRPFTAAGFPRRSCLTAATATPAVRRTLTATTAGALALLGALLGVAGAYVIVLATNHDDLGRLPDVPVLHLALAVIEVPRVATAAGWLPRDASRPPLRGRSSSDRHCS